MRSVIKAIAERALVWSGAAALSRRRMRDRVLILAYHNVVPDGTMDCGDTANHLPLSIFKAQLAQLESTHDVGPLAEILAPRKPGNRPRAAITFDDAYRGAVTLGIPEVVRQGFPATIFTAPAFLGGRSFWWDALANRAGGGLSPSLRDHALSTLRGEDAAVRAWANGVGHASSTMPDFACAATEEELLAAASLPGITLGSHTWSHPNLTRLLPTELAEEMAKPRAWLRDRIAHELPWIAYPYGLFNEDVERAAAAAGYQAALAIGGGWARPETANRFALPRVNIPPGLSARGFVLRGAGLFTG